MPSKMDAKVLLKGQNGLFSRNRHHRILLLMVVKYLDIRKYSFIIYLKK